MYSLVAASYFMLVHKDPFAVFAFVRCDVMLNVCCACACVYELYIVCVGVDWHT